MWLRLASSAPPVDFALHLCVVVQATYKAKPMVVVSHDREFLDQLCNKLVETQFGVATSYKGNYTEYVKAKEEKNGQQWAAWEKQQKEIARQVKTASCSVSGGRFV